MHDPTYRDALRAAWHFTKAHKIFWLFGFFAAFLGQMGLLDLVMKVGFVGTDYASFAGWAIMPDFLSSPFAIITHATLTADGWAAVLWALVVLFGTFVIGTFVAVVSHGALVYGSAKSFRRVGTTPHSSIAWHVGVTHFWRLFFLHAFRICSLCLLGWIVGASLVNGLITPSPADTLMFVPIFILAILVGTVISFLTVYAISYVVVEEYRLGEAISAAWRLFTRHWLVSLEVGVLILLVNVLASLLIFAAFFTLFIPAAIVWIYTIALLSHGAYIASSFIAIFCFIMFVVFTGALLAVFTTSAWTYLFMRMHKHGIGSHLLRIAGHR